MNSIKIGKNAIENLTIGMYEDSKIIYREFIQNSADSIDKGFKMGLFQNEEPYIDISIDDISRTIRIKDNAMGIKKAEIRQKLADIADSDKEKGVDKGFRGIGRLGGLAYCDTLRFITTYKGENTLTIMTWDAKELIRMINDSNIKYSADEVLARVISYEEKISNENEHYFIVELENIRRENSELLNIEEVRKYIASNAPVPYNNKFYYRTDIQKYLEDKKLSLHEYRIFVEGEDIFKNYSTILYESAGNHKKKYDEIYGIEFKEFKNSKGELLAWMWFGVSTFEKQIPSINEMRGIRLRKENIQIGGSDTLVKLFKDARDNYYFIGELHAVHKDLLPNARRDYFIENQTRVEFEEEVKDIFIDMLRKLYYYANKVKNAFKREAILLEKKSEYSAKSKKGFINSDDQKKIEEQIKVATEENERAQKDLTKFKDKSRNDPVFAKVTELIEKRHLSSIEDKVSDTGIISKIPEPVKSPKKLNWRSNNLHKLDDKQRKLISRVYGVINNVLPPEMSENLIKKIEDELNK